MTLWPRVPSSDPNKVQNISPAQDGEEELQQPPEQPQDERAGPGGGDGPPQQHEHILKYQREGKLSST